MKEILFFAFGLIIGIIATNKHIHTIENFVKKEFYMDQDFKHTVVIDNFLIKDYVDGELALGMELSSPMTIDKFIGIRTKCHWDSTQNNWSCDNHSKIVGPINVYHGEIRKEVGR